MVTKTRSIKKMSHRVCRLLTVGLLGLGMLGLEAMPSDAQAGSRRDQIQARQALKAGEIVPLRKMLGIIESQYEGDVLEVELDDDDVNGVRIWIYEIKLLTPQGNVLKMDVNAKTMKIMQVKGRGAEKARKK